MRCGTCQDKGFVVLNWLDAPQEYAVCLCQVGLQMRMTGNAGRDTGYALWQVWAAREQIDPSRVFLLEEVLTPQELGASGFEPSGATVADRETALLTASKAKRVRL